MRLKYILLSPRRALVTPVTSVRRAALNFVLTSLCSAAISATFEKVKSILFLSRFSRYSGNRVSSVAQLRQFDNQMSIKGEVRWYIREKPHVACQQTCGGERLGYYSEENAIWLLGIHFPRTSNLKSRRGLRKGGTKRTLRHLSSYRVHDVAYLVGSLNNM